MPDEISRLMPKVTACTYVMIGFFSEWISAVDMVLEFNPTAVIDYEDAQIASNMTIAERIHIVEKGKVAEHSKAKSICCERRA